MCSALGEEERVPGNVSLQALSSLVRGLVAVKAQEDHIMAAQTQSPFSHTEGAECCTTTSILKSRQIHFFTDEDWNPTKWAVNQ